MPTQIRVNKLKADPFLHNFHNYLVDLKRTLSSI